jgi:glycosyltransferase involved in cell wall biosynthesis
VRILIFDHLSGGHHGLYVERYASVLSRSHDVVAAVPEDLEAELQGNDYDVDPLPTAEAAPDLGWYRTRTAELRLLRRAIRRTRAQHVLHLFADSLLPVLVGSGLDARLSVLLFRPRAHYCGLYGDPMRFSDRGRGWIYEAALQAWRHRRNAHAVLTLDPDAARIWAGRGGAKAFFVPEPPVRAPRPETTEPIFDGVLFGLLASRKGLAFVVRALTIDPMPTRLRLAVGGPVEASYRSALAAQIRAMRKTGLDVELRLRHHSEHETVELLAAARWALVPYVGHYGMSRVLLEAAYAGTPVICHDRGLLGKLVREDGLGVTVDCEDPRKLRQAILGVAGERGAEDQYADALRAFADRHSEDRFAEHVSAPYG